MLRFIHKLRINPEDLFSRQEIKKDLAGKSVRSGMLNMISSGLMFIINLGRTVILARLLTPEDFGLIGMVTVFIGFITLFKDAGLTMATVQKEEITHQQISTLFWINVLISTGLAVLILASSPLVAKFFERPELILVTAALSFSFFWSGLTLQHMALMLRHLKLEALTVNTILSTLLGIMVSVIFALWGWRYWAIIFGSITTSFLQVLLAYFFCPWKPGLMTRGTGARDMLKFGAHLTGFSFFNYFSRNADNILIGRLLGAEPLGLYQKAYSLFMLPLNNLRNPIQYISIPVLSSLQNEPLRYQKYYFRIVNLLATFSFPLSFFLFLEADFIIRLILGDQWLNAIPVFKILAVGGIITVVGGTRGLVMISCGKSKQYFYWGIINAIITVTAFSIGISWGIEGVAKAYVLSLYLSFLPAMLYAFHNTPVTLEPFLRELLIPLLVTIIAIFTLQTIKSFYPQNEWKDFSIRIIPFIFVLSGLTLARESFRGTLVLIKKEFLKPAKKKIVLF